MNATSGWMAANQRKTGPFRVLKHTSSYFSGGLWLQWYIFPPATNFFWTIKKGHQSLQTPDEAGVDERRWPQTRLLRTFSLKDLSRLSIQKGSIERPKRTEEAPQGHKKKPRPALPVLKDSGRKTANLHLHWWSTTGRWRIKLPRFPASRVIHGEDIEGGHPMHLHYGRRIRA